jgi:hypothetical protein
MWKQKHVAWEKLAERTPLRALFTGFVVGVWAIAGNAATFELAKRADG